MSFYSFVRGAFGPLFRFLYRIKVHGTENIPEEGGLLICPNHISAMDVIFLTAVTKKRQIRYMAKAELFKIPGLKQLISALGAFPVNRGGADVGAIRKTVGILKEGGTVGIFPQGTRCTGVEPKETSAQTGVGYIAYHSGASVIPVAIITKGYKKKLFRRVDIIYGKPITNREFGFVTGKRDEQKAAADKIFGEILKLHEAGALSK